MSEAESHVLRARLEGGIRNQAARGEVRKALPVRLVWGEEEGVILLDGDEAVRGAIQTIFDRVAERGSGRQAWPWMRREGGCFRCAASPLEIDAGPARPPGAQRARESR